jgi:hypothetical protein
LDKDHRTNIDDKFFMLSALIILLTSTM